MYNREREIERQERERKEKQWEEELNTAMKGAEERLKYIFPIDQFYRRGVSRHLSLCNRFTITVTFAIIS